MNEKLSNLKITENNKSIGWRVVVGDNLHLGHVSSLLKIIMEVKDVGYAVRILIDDLDYSLKHNENLLNKNREASKKIIIKIFKSYNIKNVSFFLSSDLRNSENYVNDFYKLISVTTEDEAALCLETSNDVKMGDLLQPVLKTLDFLYLDVDIIVHCNDKVVSLVEKSKQFINLDIKSIKYINNGLICNFKNNKIPDLDKTLSIWLFDKERVVYKKINKFFCEEGNTDTSVLKIFESIIFNFVKLENKHLNITTVDGNIITYNNIEELMSDFKNKLVHPADLKTSCSNYILEIFKKFS